MTQTTPGQDTATQLLGLLGERFVTNPETDAVVSEIVSALDEVAHDIGPISLFGDGPLRLTKGLISEFSRCEARALANAQARQEVVLSTPMVLGRLMDYAVAFGLIRGRVDSALNVCVAMAEADGDDELVAAVHQRSEAERLELQHQLLDALDACALTWQGRPAELWPLFQSSAEASLGPGTIVLSARFDVEIFTSPIADISRRAVGIVEVKSSTLRDDHRADGYFYALVAMLRDASMPDWAAAWVPGQEIAVHFAASADRSAARGLSPMGTGGGALRSAASRVIGTLHRMADIDGGAVPARRAGWWCESCPLVETCDVGRQELSHNPDEFDS